MKAVQMMLQNELSLRKALGYAGWSRCAYYYEPRSRAINPDPAVLQKIEEITLERPSFGTRRMATMLSRGSWSSSEQKASAEIIQNSRLDRTL